MQPPPGILRPVEADRAVRTWLLGVYAMIFAMVLVGGITRLTGSGLSMVEWRPLMGAVPPLSDAAWHEVFAKYQRSPQYKLVNTWMTLADFKQIFFWEYLHRLLGRLIGLVFALPFVVFVVRRQIRGRLAWRTGLAFILGGLQGLLGWYMVQSGLVDRPEVSHLRLAAHLLLALLVASWIQWIWLDTRPVPEHLEGARGRGLRAGAWLLLPLVTLQLVYGAFMAGTRAGFLCATFPKMFGSWVPWGFWNLDPAWHNFFDNPMAIHFIHRLLGLVVAAAVITYWFLARRRARTTAERRTAGWLLTAVLVQLLLGILTVITHVPTALATAHQAGGVLLLAALVAVLHATERAARVSRPAPTPSSPAPRG